MNNKLAQKDIIFIASLLILVVIGTWIIIDYNKITSGNTNNADNVIGDFSVNNIGIPVSQACDFLSNNFGLKTTMWDERNRFGTDDYYCVSNNYDSRTWGGLPNDMSNISYSVSGRNRIGKEFMIHLNYHYGSDHTSYGEDFYLEHFAQAIKDLTAKVFNNSTNKKDYNSEIIKKIASKDGIVIDIDDNYLIILSDTDYWPSGKGYSQFFKIVEKSFCKNHDNCNSKYY